ncbi:MAG: hypothetical protein KBC33_00620 [Candidatus Pacebacteria bacterium]|nr:hypothetical protein [Candidatus Paceibacterota bacterium]
MSLRVNEHIFTGATTPIASYDSTKTSLGTLMVQKTGLTPQENFVGPLPVAIARPMEESTAVAMMFPHVVPYSSTVDWVFMLENSITAAKRIFLYEYDKVNSVYTRNGFITATTPFATNINRGFRALRYLHTTGTVAVAAPVSYYAAGTSVALAVTGVVTGVGTTFTVAMVGKMIGFGSTNVAQINCWYPIITFTSTLSITVSGASSAIAASANYVIASCTVTGTSTTFVADRIAAGTASTSVAGGLGPRIGFGSTDPTQITQWYQIGAIASDTSLNITTSPGVVPAGTPYVIEELRFAISLTNTTSTNGGLFLLKGASHLDFTTAGNTFPSIASNIDNQRGVYWLADAATVTNTAASGLALEAETSKTSHFAYILNGTNTTNARIFKYNLRANDAVAAGKMTLAGANIVSTGTQAVTGTIPNLSANNGTVETLAHGPGSGSSYLYFVTLTRLYCVDVSLITAGNTTFITAANIRQEIPPGGISTFPATGNMVNVQYMPTIDKLLITTYAANAAYRQYVTRYPATDTTPFDHVFGVDDKQQDQSLLSSQGVVHFNTGSQLLSADVSNGIVHITRNGATAQLNQMYSLPFGAHATYAYSVSPANHQRVITPSLATAGCVKFDQVIVTEDRYLGSGELRLSPESFRVYYRTADIASDATSSWVLVEGNGDLSSVSPANAIQFMLEFYTIGRLCLPARVMRIAVTYEDGSTDSHYQLSTVHSDATNERFAWRFCHGFGGTVPNLKIELFNAETDASLFTDTTAASANGTWHKSIDDGASWTAYNSTDKTNDITYIRYTPSALTDGISVRAHLTQN